MARRKLSDDDVSSLRGLALQGETAAQLARRFDVSAAHVRKVISGERRAVTAASRASAQGDAVGAVRPASRRRRDVVLAGPIARVGPIDAGGDESHTWTQNGSYGPIDALAPGWDVSL